MLCGNVYGVGLLSFVVVNAGKKMQTCCIGLCMEENTQCIWCLEMYLFSLSKRLSSAFLELMWSVFHVPASYSLTEMHKLKVVIFFDVQCFSAWSGKPCTVEFFSYFW